MRLENSKTMTELPTEDEEIIDADHDETLIIPIAEILYSDDRAWYTKNQINTRLQKDYNQDVSNPTIDNRLDDLLELELIKRNRIGQTDIYYYDKGSEWPVPPDVKVESTTNELTVSDLIDRVYVQLTGISIFTIILGGIIVWIGTLQASRILSFPVPSENILAVGLLAFLCSYVLLLISLVVGLLDFATDVEPTNWVS